MSDEKLECLNKAVINDCINTAVNIVNITDDDNVAEMAAHIADQLISRFIDLPEE